MKSFAAATTSNAIRTPSSPASPKTKIACAATSSPPATRVPGIPTSDHALERAAQLCADVGTDGLRGELTLVRAARALAALEGAPAIDDAHLRRVAPMALRHRLRRTPLSSPDSGARVERAVADLFGGSGERLVI